MPEITEMDREAALGLSDWMDDVKVCPDCAAGTWCDDILAHVAEAFARHRQQALSAERERIASRLEYFHIDPQIVEMVREGR